MSARGVQVLSATELGLIALNEDIDVVYGNSAVKLTRPSGKTILVMQAESGNWLVKPGDYVSAFPAQPTSTTTAGTAGSAPWPIKEGRELAIAANDIITVKGTGATDRLVYYWL